MTNNSSQDNRHFFIILSIEFTGKNKKSDTKPSIFQVYPFLNLRLLKIECCFSNKVKLF